MMNGWAAGGYGWAAAILALVFLAFVVVGIVLLVRGFGGSSRSAPPMGREEHTPEVSRKAAALDILEERYARGEIDREEFVQRKKDLTG